MPPKIVGICPAAGRGTRLGDMPGSKELFPIGFHPYEINGAIKYYPKPISQYLLESMVSAGAERLFMIVSSGKEELMRFYGNGQRIGAKIAYLYQETLNGMPFALDLPFDWLQNEITLFGMPDTLIEPRDAFAQLLAAHLANKDDVTLGLFKTANPQKFGMVELDDNDNIIYCIDKPDQTHLEYLWGIAVWNYNFSIVLHEYLEKYLKPGLESELVLSKVFSRAIAVNLKVRGYKFLNGSYLDIGTVDDLRQTILHVLEKYPGPGADRE